MHIREPISKNSYLTETLKYNRNDDNKFDNTKIGILPTKENKAFLSIIAHNIKNPFGALLGFSEMILEDYEELNDTEKKLYISEINKTSKLAYKYLDRFFEWSYYKTGKIKLNFDHNNLRELISISVEKTLLSSNYTGEVKLNIDKNIEVRVDSESIVKMFHYLIENAMKFSSPNGEVEIKTDVNENFVIIKIIDNGIGIKEEKLRKLFNITENVGVNEKHNEFGTGLGLILTEQLVNLNNGSIKINSSSGVGTTVTVKLPL